jgi:hypothetical protein
MNDYVESLLGEEVNFNKKFNALLKLHNEKCKDYEHKIQEMGLEIRQLQAIVKKLGGQFVSASELAGEPQKSDDVLDQLLK